MAIRDEHKFKGITHIGKEPMSRPLLSGVIDFFQWSFLSVGGFQNITMNPAVSGVFGGQRFRLRPVQDPRYTDGQVWEGFRSDWVWESGISTSVSNSQPIRVSGIYVDGSFKTVTPYKNRNVHSGAVIDAVGYVDYPSGRIILTTEISTSSTVNCEFSHRYVSVIPADTSWFRELQFNSYRVEDDDFLTSGSGNWSQISETRRHLPVIAVEMVPRRTFEGYQLGGGQWLRQDILFHIIAENAWDRDQLVDIVTYQNDKNLYMPDLDAMQSSVDFPISLDFRGSPVKSAKMYPDIIDSSSGLRGKKFRFINTNVQEMGQINPRLFGAIVRSTCESIVMV